MIERSPLRHSRKICAGTHSGSRSTFPLILLDGVDDGNFGHRWRGRASCACAWDFAQWRERNPEVTCAGGNWVLCIHLTSDSSMLAVRTSFPILRLRRSTRQSKSLVQVMAHGQTNWKPPARVTGEPVLKVYNTFTRTKVRPFRACLAPFDFFSFVSGRIYSV